MAQEPQKNNNGLIVIAIIGVVGTIIATAISVIGNYNIEKFRQEAELTRIALVSIATQGGATQVSMAGTISAPTNTPYLQPTYTPVPTQIIEVTREVTVIATIPTPTPAYETINVNYEGRTHNRDVIYYINTIELTSKGKMRWNLSFWNQATYDTQLRLDLDNCAYVADLDNGTRYAIYDHNFPLSGSWIKIQAQTRVDLWFEFEDAISTGARRFTVGLCPNGAGGFYFDQPTVEISP